MICFPMPLTFCKLSENTDKPKIKIGKKVHMHMYMHAWYTDTERKKAEINHIWDSGRNGGVIVLTCSSLLFLYRALFSLDNSFLGDCF